jgi:hypothetical protein
MRTPGETRQWGEWVRSVDEWANGIVDAFEFLYRQPQRAWSFELDVRTSRKGGRPGCAIARVSAPMDIARRVLRRTNPFGHGPEAYGPRPKGQLVANGCANDHANRRANPARRFKLVG